VTVLDERRVRRRDASPDRAADAVRPPARGRDRRILVVVASIALIAASIASFAALYSSAGARTAAIVVTRSLTQGQPITSASIGEVDVSVPAGVDYIPVSEASLLVGKHAVAAVPKGALLTLSDLSAAPALAADQAVVGLALKDGTFPSGGLSPGDQVMVVQTAGSGATLAAPVASAASSSSPSSSSVGTLTGGTGTAVATTSGAGVLVARATVASVSVPAATASGGYALLASVQVASAAAPSVTTAAAAGQVSLVLLPRDTSMTSSASSGVAP
jgi:hypothetical protein